MAKFTLKHGDKVEFSDGNGCRICLTANTHFGFVIEAPDGDEHLVLRPQSPRELYVFAYE